MLQFLHRHKGSVTILLCVIMIPVLVFSFGILDICKIMMAKDAVTGTTNLALNAGLTSYDKVLKDMYGILATSKTNDQLSEKMSKYYIASLNSAGIEGVDESWVRGIMSDLVGNSIDNEALENNQNFMRVTPVAGANGKYVTATKLLSSAASNPEVLERQIVEHMKYRAPLNLAVGMLEKLNAMKDVSNMADAQNSQIKFEKSLNKINNTAIDLYTMLMMFFYNNQRLETGSGTFDIVYKGEKTEIISQYQYLGNTKLPVSDVETNIAMQVAYLEAAAIRVAMYAPYNDLMRSGTLNYAMPNKSESTIKSMAKTDNETEDQLGTALRQAAENVKKDPEYNTVIAYAEQYNELSMIGEDGQPNYNTAYMLYFSGIAALPAFNPFPTVSEVYAMDGSAKRFSQAYETFLYEYAAMELIIKDLQDECDEKEREYTKAYKKYDNLLNSENYTQKQEEDAKKARDEAKKEWEEADLKVKEVEKILQESTISKVKSDMDELNENVKASVEIQFDKAEKEYASAANTLAEVYQGICKQYLILLEVTKENGYLDLLAKEVAEAQTQSVDYQNKINAIETSTQRNSSQIRYDNEAATLAKVDTTKIEELRTALTAMMDDYMRIKLAIENIWILGENNKIVHSIATGSEIWAKFSIDGKDPNSNEDQNYNLLETKTITTAGRQFAADYRLKYYGTQDAMKNTLSRSLVNKDYGSNIKPSGVYGWAAGDYGQVGGTPFSKWTHYGMSEFVCPKKIADNPTYETVCEISRAVTTETGDTSAAEAIKSGATAQANSKGEGSTIPGNQEASAAAPESNNESEGKETAPTSSMSYEQISTIPTFAETYKAGEGTDTDTTKGFSMNIDATQEDQEAVADQASNALDAVSKMLDVLEDIFTSGRDALYVTEYLTKNFSCATTNLDGKGGDIYAEKMLNGQYYKQNGKAALSIAYRSELEYILYGFNSPEANVAAAGAIIFGIRFALNLIYSYTDSEIRATTLAAATAIGGIFPFSIPLIQTVLHVALAIAESSCDLFKLMDGAAVPLFKTKSTWVCKGSNIVREVAKVVVEEVVNTAIDAATAELTKQIESLGDSISEGAIQQLDGYATYVNEQITAISSEVHDAIMTPIHEVVQQVLMTYGEAMRSATGLSGEENTAMKALLTTTLDKAITRMEAAIGTQPGGGDTDYVQMMKAKALQYVKDNRSSIVDKLHASMKDFVDATVNTTAQTITDGTNMLDDKISSVLKDVEDVIIGAVNEFTDEIKSGISKGMDTIVTKVNEGVEMTADELKSALSNAVQGGARGHKNIEITGKDAVSKGSDFALEFTYKDYLYVFTLIGAMANSSNMMMRTAQMMAANCRNNGAASDYTLNNATTLLRADVQGKVGTLFYGAVFTEDGQLDLSGRTDYEFKYSSYMGY